MKIQNFKKYAFGLALVLGFVVTPSLSSLFTIQAQDWRWGQNRRNDGQNGRWERGRDRRERGRNDGYNGHVDRNGNIDRNRNGVDDRYENNGRYRRNDGNYGRNDRYGRNYPYGRNDGYYGNGGYNNNNGEFQRGYRDGLDRGRKDAQTNRAMTPNNSSHYQRGNSSYRAGFERGFFESYRQYSGRRW
jgi:hypothetical protein